MRVIIALVAWAAAVIGAVAVSNAVSSSIHTRPAASVGASSGASGSSSSAGAAGVDPSSIKSTDSVSLFRTANFGKALAKTRAALGPNAQIDSFTLYPGYLVAIAVKGGSEVDFSVDASGTVQQSATGGSADGSSLFRLSQIGAGTPAALARRIETAAHVPVSQLHYLTVLVDPVTNHGLWWLVYPLQGNRVEYFRAPGATGQLLELPANSSSGPHPISG